MSRAVSRPALVPDGRCGLLGVEGPQAAVRDRTAFHPAGGGLPPLMSEDWPGLLLVGPAAGLLLLGLGAIALALYGGRRTARGPCRAPAPARLAGGRRAGAVPGAVPDAPRGRAPAKGANGPPAQRPSARRGRR